MSYQNQIEAMVKSLKAEIPALAALSELDAIALKDLPREHAAVKAELEKLPQKVREDFENWLDMQPNTDAQMKTPADKWIDMSQMSAEDFQKQGGDGIPQGVTSIPEHAFRKSYLSPAEMVGQRRAKATIGATENAPGAAHMPGHVWSPALPGDPWPGVGALQLPLSSGNFSTVKLDGLAFANETDVTHASFDTTTGAIAATSRTVKNYALRAVVPLGQADDVPALLSQIEQFIVMAYGKLRGSLTTAAIVAGAKAGNTVTTGSANTALTNANAFSKLLSLTGQGSLADYWPLRPAFVLHPLDFTNLYQDIAGKSGFAMDPATGLPAMGAWPIAVDSQAEANATSGKHPDFFGAWSAALIQAQRGRLTIDRFMQTIPGAIAIYANFRFLPVAVNNEAYAAIKVGA